MLAELDGVLLVALGRAVDAEVVPLAFEFDERLAAGFVESITGYDVQPFCLGPGSPTRSG